MKSCTWKEDDDGIYETECGGAFFFDTGNVEENRFKFCPYCGDLIAAHPPEAEGMDEAERYEQYKDDESEWIMRRDSR